MMCISDDLFGQIVRVSPRAGGSALYARLAGKWFVVIHNSILPYAATGECIAAAEIGLAPNLPAGKPVRIIFRIPISLIDNTIPASEASRQWVEKYVLRGHRFPCDYKKRTGKCNHCVVLAAA